MMTTFVPKSSPATEVNPTVATHLASGIYPFTHCLGVVLAPPVLKWLYRVWPERTELEGGAPQPEATRGQPVHA